MNTNWIIPCNLTVYNALDHFEKDDYLYWGAFSSTKVGDIIYLYVGKPLAEIKYKCHVVETNIDIDTIKASKVSFLVNRKNRHNYIRMELDECFPSGLLPYSALKENGLVTIQTQTKMNEELTNYITLNTRKER